MTKIFESKNEELVLRSELDVTVNQDKTVTVQIYLPNTNQRSYAHALTLAEVIALSRAIRQLIPELDQDDGNG